jgi:hypothetical protein
LPLKRGKVVERNVAGIRQHGPELRAPEIVAHKRQRATGEAVKSAVGVKQGCLSGGGARKLNGALHAFAAGAGEKHLA